MIGFRVVGTRTERFTPSRWFFLTVAFVAMAGFSGCRAEEGKNGEDSSDDETSTDDAGDEDTGGSGGEDLYNQACHEALARGTVLVGEPCNDNTNCESRACLAWSNYRPPDSGVCVEPPADCLSRASGEVIDVHSGEPVAAATVGIVGGTVVVADATGAHRVGEGTSNEYGLYDTVTNEPVKTFYNVMTVVENEDYYPTVTVLDWPLDEALNYAPVLSLHTQYATSKVDLAAWNAALQDDPDFSGSIPIEEHGVTVGFVQLLDYPVLRVEGAVITPMASTSAAKVRYVNEDGVTIGTEATSSNGTFIILGAEIGERFDVVYEGYKLTRWAARAGPVVGAVYATPFLLEPE